MRRLHSIVFTFSRFLFAFWFGCMNTQDLTLQDAVDIATRFYKTALPVDTTSISTRRTNVPCYLTNTPHKKYHYHLLLIYIIYPNSDLYCKIIREFLLVINKLLRLSSW